MGCCASQEPGFERISVLTIANPDMYKTDPSEQLTKEQYEERVLSMIEDEPHEAGHLANHAVIAMKDGRSVDQVRAILDQAEKVDPRHVRTKTLYAEMLLRIKDHEGASQKYREGHEIMFSAGTKMLDANDVIHVVNYAVFAEQIEKNAKRALELYKEAALNAPKSAMAQGNYGLYLARTGARADAEPRLQSAVELGGGEFWEERLASFQRGR